MKGIPIVLILIGLLATQYACGLTRTLPAPTSATGQAVVITPTGVVEPIKIPTPSDTPSPAPTSTFPSVTATAPTSPINLDVLKNFPYWIPDFNTSVALQNGALVNNKIVVRLYEQAAFGDLNGDGQQDAAAILVVHPGELGYLFYLVPLLNQNNTLEQAGIDYIGDEQKVNDIEIASGRIILDYVTQKLNHPLYSPTDHRLRSYVVEAGKPRLVSEQILESTTAQATPLSNEIFIDLPGMGDRMINPQQISGRVSQVPPDRALHYRITQMTKDLKEDLLFHGDVPVNGEPGGPGTFTFQFSLDPLSHGQVSVEIADSANGILRGRSAVIVIGSDHFGPSPFWFHH